MLNVWHSSDIQGWILVGKRRGHRQEWSFNAMISQNVFKLTDPGLKALNCFLCRLPVDLSDSRMILFGKAHTLSLVRIVVRAFLLIQYAGRACWCLSIASGRDCYWAFEVDWVLKLVKKIFKLHKVDRLTYYTFIVRSKFYVQPKYFHLPLLYGCGTTVKVNVSS